MGVKDTQTRQESTPCCHSYFWLNNDAHLQKPLQLWLKRAETHIFGKNQILMIKPSMPCQGKRLTGVMLFWVNLNGFLVSFQGPKKKNTKPWLMQQSMVTHLTLLHSKIKVEHESSQLQQLHNLLWKKDKASPFGRKSIIVWALLYLHFNPSSCL